jgi:hypothetical protein
MTPESRNSLLLDNGSLTDVCVEMRIYGDRFGTFRVNGISNFHGYALGYKSWSADNIDSFLRQPSFKGSQFSRKGVQKLVSTCGVLISEQPKLKK